MPVNRIWHQGIFFMKNHTQNVVEKLVPDLSIKKPTLSVTLLKCYKVCFYCMFKSRSTKLLKLRCWPLAFTLYKTFLKNKERSGTILPTWFSAWFLNKNISHAIFYNLTKFHCLMSLFLEILGNMYIVNIYYPVCDSLRN